MDRVLRERLLKDFDEWMKTLYKGGVKLTSNLVISALNGDGTFLDVFLKKLNIKTKQEFDNFYNNEYLPWLKKRNAFVRKYKGNKLNHQAFKELYKYFEGTDYDFAQLRKQNRTIIEELKEINNEIHLDLRTNKNKKLKQLENFLERLKTRNVENYICAYKLYGLDWKNYPLRDPENWEQLLKVIKDK